MRRCDKNIKSALSIAQQMIELADKGDKDREDIGCGILYGIIRDSAYKIIQLAEKEKQAHINKGWWNSNRPL